MGKLSGQFERYCFECGSWFDAPSNNELCRCTKCNTLNRWAKCNRCEYEWKMHRTRYPDNCPKCKNPYYNIKRIQSRENIAKRYDDVEVQS